MSRTFGLIATEHATTDRYAFRYKAINAPTNWGVLDLGGRSYLVNESFTEAVPANGRGPGAYGWTRQTRHAKANGQKRSKVLARILKARMKAMVSA